MAVEGGGSGDFDGGMIVETVMGLLRGWQWRR